MPIIFGCCASTPTSGASRATPRELRDRIEHHRNRRSIGDAAKVSDKYFRLVQRLVVIRSFHQRDMVAKFRGALRAFDGFRGGLGAGSRDEAHSRRGGFFHRDENSVDFFAREQHGFAGRANRDVASETCRVVLGDVVLDVLDGNGAISGKWRGKRGKNTG